MLTGRFSKGRETLTGRVRELEALRSGQEAELTVSAAPEGLRRPADPGLLARAT